jgi:hypothetical protein
MLEKVMTSKAIASRHDALFPSWSRLPVTVFICAIPITLFLERSPIGLIAPFAICVATALANLIVQKTR